MDPEYRALYKRLWLFYAGGAPTPGTSHAAYPGVVGIVDSVAARVATDVESIRSRGGDVIFIRFPATGPVYASESRGFPRQSAWEPFLAKTHTAGVHFEDYPQLQGYNLPEWSHMAAQDSGRFTRALAPLTLRKRRLTVSTR